MWDAVMSVGIHYCVRRLQHNCEPLEMMEGYSIVTTGFWGKFFQFFFGYFFFIYIIGNFDVQFFKGKYVYMYILFFNF